MNIKNIIKNNHTYMWGLLLSTVLQLISLNCFYLNSDLTTGGVSGLSLSAMYWLNNLHILPFKVTFGLLYLALNILLFIYAWFTINKKFTFYSLLNVVLVSILSDHLPVIHLTNEVLLNAIFGAIFFAFAIVVSLSYGQSTGGTDILGIAFAKKGIGSIGIINIIVSIIAFGLILSTKEFKIFGYSLLSEVLLSIIVDLFYNHSRKETVLIISKQHEKIRTQILQNLDRGCTLLDATGGYSREETKVVLVVISKDQLNLLHSIVNSIDPKAFTNSWATNSVKGEWVDRIGEHKYTLSHINNITKNIEKTHEAA